MESYQTQSLVDFDGYESEDVAPELEEEDTPQFGAENSVDEEEQPSSNFLTDFLKSYGIDRNKIKFSNEDGTIEEVSFDDLDDTEKLDLMLSTQTPVISDQEIATLNFLRSNRLNLADYVEAQRQQAVKDYLEQNKSYNYAVDGLSDKELYAYELQENYPDLTSEEIEAEVDRAMENEELFGKKIAAIRNNYKKLEDDRLAEQKQTQQREREQEWEDFTNNMVTVARNTNELHNLILEDEDKEEVLSYLLDKDGNEQTEFIKLLSDPQRLFELAWYALKGKDAFDKLEDYYKNEIVKSRRSQYSAPAKKVIKKQPTKETGKEYDIDSYFV